MKSPAGVGAREDTRFGGGVPELVEGGGVDWEVVYGFVARLVAGPGVVIGEGYHGEDGGLVRFCERVALSWEGCQRRAGSGVKWWMRYGKSGRCFQRGSQCVLL